MDGGSGVESFSLVLFHAHNPHTRVPRIFIHVGKEEVTAADIH